MNRAEHIGYILKWEKEYGKPPADKEHNLAAIKCACTKCGHIRRRMQRHHKACDFIFARTMPDKFARRYIEFREEDCDRLCESCHKWFHTWVEPFTRNLLIKIQLRENASTLTYEWLEDERQHLLSLYRIWLTRAIRSRKRRR